MTAYQDLIESLDPATYQRLKRALETGKWPDGRMLSEQQQRSCMDAIIHWEARYLSPEERTGYIDPGSKGKAAPGATEQILQLQDKPE
jgi:hypothetical protein